MGLEGGWGGLLGTLSLQGGLSSINVGREIALEREKECWEDTKTFSRELAVPDTDMLGICS